MTDIISVRIAGFKRAYACLVSISITYDEYERIADIKSWLKQNIGTEHFHWNWIWGNNEYDHLLVFLDDEILAIQCKLICG